MKIEIKNYTKIIKGSTVLDNINVVFESGKIYGLKGKNGSGKTMLMRAISGLIRPSSGEVMIENEVLGRDISFPRSIGVLIENPAFLANETGFSNLRMLADLGEGVSNEDIEAVLSELGLDSKDKKSYKKYSLGMKQKLGIAAAVMEHPDIIILDEPINALDQDSVEVVKKIIIRERDRGAVIILACHDTEELEYLSDEIVCIQDGKIISG
ncbi:MAG: ATP-binding cassette domain-containing protein [Lachnospiraceae bacterium]|nr:ATP-binding cassette domain-containing protein [Lachnospiraceae bacterium]MCI9368991.1 ATP-binding cassette domain-containing protein [Lachnospiraceae bacterium]